MAAEQTFWVVLVVVLVVVIVVTVIGLLIRTKPSATTGSELSPEQKAEQDARFFAHRAELDKQWLIHHLGPIRPQVICPHCQVKGHVRGKAVTDKKGVSGGKATAAVLTAGVSMLATGLSRKEAATAATCDNCQSTWRF